MNTNDTRSIVSCDPKSIWPLDEGDRQAAVIVLVQQCAKEFQDAVLRNDPGGAQDFAIGALGAVGGLFPNPNDPAHVLLTSLVGILTDAKSGRIGHFLMQNARPIIGAMRGNGHVYIGGFAISAVELLIKRNRQSALSARKQVASLLAKAGCSLRKGDHGEAKPITHNAIRNWHENPANFPFQHEIAADMASVHAANLTARHAVTLDDDLAYLNDQAIAAMQHSRFL